LSKMEKHNESVHEVFGSSPKEERALLQFGRSGRIGDMFCRT
jgi:hypothetical protein